MTTSQGQFVYWFAMKLLLWVIPAIVLIRYSGRKFVEVMSIKRFQSMIVWGCGVGLVLGVITIIIKILGHQPLFSFENTLSFISGVIIAPIVEEITFRGAVLGSLTQHYRFAVANTLTALFFLGAQISGWYFQGSLMNNLSSPVGGALSIFILGLVFGYIAHRSKSVSGSIITHILNNLFNA
jgi:membrane protease YdiL (CAAX protease family)